MPKGKGSMSSKAASRIQSSTAKSGGGKVSKGSFAARAQRAAAKNTKRLSGLRVLHSRHGYRDSVLLACSW